MPKTVPNAPSSHSQLPPTWYNLKQPLKPNIISLRQLDLYAEHKLRMDTWNQFLMFFDPILSLQVSNLRILLNHVDIKKVKTITTLCFSKDLSLRDFLSNLLFTLRISLQFSRSLLKRTNRLT